MTIGDCNVTVLGGETLRRLLAVAEAKRLARGREIAARVRVLDVTDFRFAAEVVVGVRVVKGGVR